MAIKYDASGFIIGERRLKEMSQGITKTEDNTAKILKIISEGQLSLEQSIKAVVETNRTGLARQNRDAKSVSATEQSQAVKKTVEAASDIASVSRDVLRQAREVDLKERRKVRSSDNSSSVTSVSERTQRERDSNGRFTSGNGGSESRGLFGWIKSIKGSVDGANVDVGGIDPTIDALREVKDVVSPVGRVFGGMGARAIGVFRGRMKKRATDEQLPQEQIKANKEQQRSDKQRNSLLRRLIDAVRMGSKGGGIGDMAGGLFGGLGKRGGGLFKKGGKLLLKRLPFLGALVGGAFLAKDWKGLDTKGKGKGIGQIIGTAVGGVLGTFLGPIGTVGGGMLGNWLGGIFGEKVGGWVDQLKGEDWTGIFKSAVSGMADFAKKAFIPYRLGEAVGNGASNLWDKAKSFGSRVFGGGDGPVTKKGSLSADKQKSISRVAKNIGVDPNDLASIISFETAGTFSTNARNPKSSATGLIQFMSGTGGKDGKYYGMTRDQFGALSFDEQMNYVEKYYKERGFNGKKKRSLADAYTAVSGYGYKRGSKAYELNEKWDTDNNGVVGKGEAVQNKAFQAHRKNWISSEETIAENKAKIQRDQVTNEAPKINKLVVQTQQQQIFKPGVSRPAPIKVPVISPELAKIGQHSTAFAATKAPSDITIGQTVSDRSIAHVLSGGLGYDQHSV